MRQGRSAHGLIVIGGSTASGKSALALALAEAVGGVVVNADSQQLFRDLPTLTARPTPEDEAAAPHRLYGVLGPDEQPSVARWLALALSVLAEATAQRRPAIVTGGTGLYLHALLHGLPEIPDIPDEVRGPLRATVEREPAEATHARLAVLDPVMAARLRPSDRQRILRALEVVLATGRSLAEWQATPRRRPLLPASRLTVALVPPARVVAPRIETRLARMLAAGVLGEVEDLRRRRPDVADLPIAKVHGVRDLLAVQGGRQSLDEAAARIAAQIRQYAKRQRTWFRHQLPELEPIAAVGEDPAVLAHALARWNGQAD